MTKKLFYCDPYLREATGRIVEVRTLDDGRVAVLLDGTIFYPEGGGQPSDRGIIEGDGFRVIVEKVSGKDKIWHEGKLEGRLPKEGETVRLVLDWEWRYENMRAHTGQHILSAVIKGLYGANTTGFQIFPDHNKIEIDYPGELNWEMILEVEKRTNEVIWGDLPVEVEVYDELPEDIKARLRKEVAKNVKPPIRIVRIGTVDVTPCGGTHVRSTREVGFLKVLRFYRKSRKLWRIEFATGSRALRALNGILEDYWASLNEMPNKNPPLKERVLELRDDLRELTDEKDSLRRELWEWKGKVLLASAEDLNGIRLVAHLEDAPMKDAQAFAVDFVAKNPRTVLILVGRNYLILARNRNVVDLDMRTILREVLSRVGGRGGGTEVLAKGGGFKAKPEEVLELVVETIKSELNPSKESSLAG